MDPLQWVAFAGPAGPTTAPAVSAETSSNSPDGLAQGTQIKIVRRLVPHPSAHGAPGLYSYDLALVELLQPLDFDGVFVDKVCLGGDDVAEEDECVVAGWKNGQQGGTRVPTLYSQNGFSTPQICSFLYFYLFRPQFPSVLEKGHHAQDDLGRVQLRKSL